MSLPTKQASLVPSDGQEGAPPGALVTTVSDALADLTRRVEALEQGLVGHTHVAPEPVVTHSVPESEPVEDEEPPPIVASSSAPEEAAVTLKNGDVITSAAELTPSRVAKMTKSELVDVCGAFSELGVPNSADRSKKEIQAAVLQAITA